MDASEFVDYLYWIFKDRTLFGFTTLERDLSEKTHCKCVLVTLLPFPDLKYMYNGFEYFEMAEGLRKKHSEKLNKVKLFLQGNQIGYAIPPASPKDDGEYLAEFSYKWAAIHAGLGFIGKNDVFVHYKYAQRVRISCLLVDLDMPVFNGEVDSKCGNCRLCVDACPHGFITGNAWYKEVHREELIDYKKCATKSKYGDSDIKYLCARCSLACTYPDGTRGR